MKTATMKLMGLLIPLEKWYQKAYKLDFGKEVAESN